MTVEANGALNDTSLFQDLVSSRLSRVHFALIEKRGIVPLQFSAGMTFDQKSAAFQKASRDCSREYVKHATKPSRVSDVIATVRALHREPWVRQVILAGHSEGTHVATGVVRQAERSEILAAGLFASAGQIAFFGDYLAGARTPDRLRTVFDTIRMLQNADDDFIYEGLPARRWKTFCLDSTSLDDVRDSDVPLFIAQGTRGGSTLPADLFTLEAIRLRPKRPLRYVVVDQAAHDFSTPDGKDRLPGLFDDFVSWSLDPRRRTGIAQLK